MNINPIFMNSRDIVIKIKELKKRFPVFLGTGWWQKSTEYLEDLYKEILFFEKNFIDYHGELRLSGRASRKFIGESKERVHGK